MSMPEQLEFDASIRQVEIEGVVYFSILDVLTHNYDTGNPYQSWKTIKAHVLKQGYEDIVEKIIWHQFPGQGQRETPIVTAEIWEKLVAVSGFLHFSHQTLFSEINQLQPLVRKMLEKIGWKVKYPIELPSNKIVDLMATKNDETLLVECKRNLEGHHLFTAIGQVLCYCTEFGKNATPAIATYQGKIDSYGLAICSKLGIQVLQVKM